jgi:hypothetical protein
MDATKTKKMNHQCLIANVTKLVVAVDIVRIQLGATTASLALIGNMKSPKCMMMEVDIVQKRLMDVGKNMETKKDTTSYLMIALVMNLVAPVNIMMIKLISTTASPALNQDIQSTKYMMTELEIVK